MLRDGASSSLDVYVDGVLVPFSGTPIDNRTDTMTNTPRSVRIAGFGGASDDRIHSVAIWGAGLTGFDVTTLYNGGAGADPDYRVNSGTYDKAACLLHWWRLGFETGNLGKDFGNYFPMVDVMEDNLDIDATEVVSDFPGM